MSQGNVYAALPLEKLMESPMNYRTSFDETKLASLVDSVKSIGIRAPLLVRPIAAGKPLLSGDLLAADAFEIAAGHRRFRAAGRAGLAAAPCIVSAMTDEVFIETLYVDNLQRADIHALEEAAGYRELLKRPGYDAHVIAAKVAKTVIHVQRRLSLLKLTPECKRAFEQNVINPAMALILARLTPEWQKSALELLTHKNDWNRINSSRKLQAWVEDEILRPLKKAPFDPKNAELVPAAGSCVECPKRTGFMPELFPEVKSHDTCTDPRCYQAKTQAALLIKIEDATKKNGGEELVLVSLLSWIAGSRGPRVFRWRSPVTRLPRRLPSVAAQTFKSYVLSVSSEQSAALIP